MQTCSPKVPGCVCVMPGLTQLQEAYMSWELILMPPLNLSSSLGLSPSTLDPSRVVQGRKPRAGSCTHLNQSRVLSHENILGAPGPCWCPPVCRPVCKKAVYTFMHASRPARPATIPDHSSPPRRPPNPGTGLPLTRSCQAPAHPPRRTQSHL